LPEENGGDYTATFPTQMMLPLPEPPSWLLLVKQTTPRRRSAIADSNGIVLAPDAPPLWQRVALMRHQGGRLGGFFTSTTRSATQEASERKNESQLWPVAARDTHAPPLLAF